MPIYGYACKTCEVTQDHMSSYADKPDSIPCECGSQADYHFGLSAPKIFKTSTGSGMIGNGKRVAPKDVGPLSKSSKAYEKKMDDENSSDAYKPGGTFGSGGTKGFKKRQETLSAMDAGKTNFTK